MKAIRSVIFLLALFGASRAPGALLLSTFGDLQMQGASFQQNQYLAQQFSIPNTATLEDVSLVFVDNNGPAFGGQLQIVNKIGVDATLANVLFTTPITLPSGASPTIVSVSAPVTLSPGDYYVLLSTTDPLPLQTRWALTSTSAPGTPAMAGDPYFSISQNTSLPAASPFSTFTGFPTPTYLALEINGVIPEPLSGELSLMGMILAAAIFRMRKLDGLTRRCR
jgi:hypothetical protein